MRFTLHYRGPLKSNGGPDDKHEIRRRMHVQLARLWSERPLVDYAKTLLQDRATLRPGSYCLLRPFGAFTFVPLVNAEMDAVATLTISLLRPGAPGKIIGHGGDIDNRLKTLFDAIAMPQHLNQLPSGASPGTDEAPFFCLLEDDSLVTSVSVRTAQLLEPAPENEVDLLIEVETHVTRHTISNSPLS